MHIAKLGLFSLLHESRCTQVAEYDNCKLLLVDKKISTARDMIGILEGAIRGGYPLLIMAEDIEQVGTGTIAWPCSCSR